MAAGCATASALCTAMHECGEIADMTFLVGRVGAKRSINVAGNWRAENWRGPGGVSAEPPYQSDGL